MDFAHLHVHTQYSLLEGAIPVDTLLERVKALGMTSVAITDTHNLFGAVHFYLEAKAAGLHPIIGCEILYAPRGRSGITAQVAAQSPLPRAHHLVLLCKDLAGYQNLCQMVTQSYKD